MSAGPEHPAEYVAARRALLDALDALHNHRPSLILIGAQAVYVHAPSTSSNVAPMTTDADVAIDTDLLGDNPEIGETLEVAGFVVSQPGHWENNQGVAVDLMVAPHQAKRPAGSRAADLAPHARGVARIAPGLAAALTDNRPMEVESLEDDDTRIHQIRVAGPAALLVAKLIKLDERLSDAARGKSERVVDKDALDVLRLLQSVDVGPLVSGLRSHDAGTPARAEVERAMDILRDRALQVDQQIPPLASRAAGDDPSVAPSLVALAADLLDAWEAFLQAEIDPS